MRRIKLFATGVIIGLVLIIAGISIISFLYRDKLAGFLLTEINKRVDTKVEIRKINFTILKKFPQASLELTDVLIRPTNRYKFQNPYNTDTLLYARKAYLQFNIIYLLKEKFILSKIHMDQAVLYLQVNKDGQGNFDILKKDRKKGEDISVDLKDVKCSRTDIHFFNAAKNLKVHFQSYNSRIKGNLSSDNTTISSISELYVYSIRSENITLLKNTPADLNLELNTQPGKLVISKGEIEFKGQYFGINGEIDTRKTVILDLHLHGTKLNLDDLMASFPDSVQKKMDIDVTGELFFQAHVKGPWSVTKYPHVSAKFGIHKGELTRNGITISDANFEGKFNNGKGNNLETSFLSLDPVSFRLESEKIEGKVKVQNLKTPKALIRCSVSFDLQRLNKFLKISALSDEEGKIKGNIQATVDVTNVNDLSTKNIRVNKIEGFADFQNVAFRWKDMKKRFSNINGRIDIDQQLTLKNISVKLANNDLAMNGTIDNFFEYLNHKDTLYVSGKLHSDYLNSDELSSALAGISPGTGFALPDSVVMDLNVTVGSFKWKNFTSHTLLSRVIYQPRTFLFQPLSLQTMGGAITGNVAFGIKNNNIDIDVQGNLKEIDISKMFESFGNFGQTVLQDKHLKGIVSGTVNFHSVWNNRFEIYKDKIETEADIEIRNGELIDFAPMLALSKYIDVSELKHVRFATLKNSIYIKDNVVHIPSMDIASNAIDISLSGTHDFSNSYDYHVTLSLADILWKKSRKKDQFGEVEEDRGRMKTHLVIKGKGNDYEVNYDRKKAREEFSNHLAQEKQTVRSILHEELGWFKKDTAVKVIPERNNKRINISWEEAENNLTAETPKDTASSKRIESPSTGNKPKIEWDDQ